MSKDHDELLEERVRQMLAHCEMVNIRILDFAAKRMDDRREPTTARMASESSYLVNEHEFRNRYVWTASLLDDSSEVIAEMSATIIVEYDVHEGFQPDAEAADKIAGSTGFFAAYPYVRELFQSCTARLQLDPVVLGMLLAGSAGPRSVTIVQNSNPDR